MGRNLNEREQLKQLDEDWQPRGKHPHANTLNDLRDNTNAVKNKIYQQEGKKIADEYDKKH